MSGGSNQRKGVIKYDEKNISHLMKIINTTFATKEDETGNSDQIINTIFTTKEDETGKYEQLTLPFEAGIPADSADSTASSTVALFHLLISAMVLCSAFAAR